MRTPSVKTLSRIFDNPRTAKNILTANRQTLLENPIARAYRDKCYNASPTRLLRLECLNALGGFHGVEYVETSAGHHAYLNAGDSYNETIIVFNGIYRVQSIADFVEKLENRGVKVK